MKKFRITFISDTHLKHKQITSSLPGGDLILHAGDLTSMGYKHEIQQFCKWYKELKGYNFKVFVAGNHDMGFENHPEMTKEILDFYNDLIYLQDSSFGIYDMDADKTVNIWGSPWQPEFYNWGFNLPRNGPDLEEKWSWIPDNTDILVTHGPPWGHLDVSGYGTRDLGCELLLKRVEKIKPKIHVFGHIHGSYGYKFDGNTHYINACVLNEGYNFTNPPLTIDWDPETNEIEFL
jgi:Icc-related predicted phosphoesterase